MIATTIYEGTHDVHRRRDRLRIARGGSRVQAQQVELLESYRDKLGRVTALEQKRVRLGAELTLGLPSEIF